MEGDVHQVDYDYIEIPKINIENVEKLEGDKGEVLTCVLEKILIAPKQLATSQLYAIFQMCYSINEKVCKVLVDSGSMEKIFLIKVVKDLNLQIIKKPKSYRIS